MTNFVKIALFLFPFLVFGQDRQSDSLKLALKSSKSDTTKCILLYNLALLEKNTDSLLWLLADINKICESNLKNTNKSFPTFAFYSNYRSKALINLGEQNLILGNLNEALLFFKKNYQIQDTTINSESLGDACFYMAGISYKLGDLNLSLDYYKRSLKNYEVKGIISSQEVVLSEMANVYFDIGNIKEALEYNFKSLALCEKNNNKTNIPFILKNIGLIYSGQGDYKKALEYLFKSLLISKELKKELEVSKTLHAIGFVYNVSADRQNSPSKKTDKALAIDYYEKSLAISEKLNNKLTIAYTLNNLGTIYSQNGNNDMALKYFTKSLKIQTELNEKEGIAYAMANIGGVYLKQKKIADAIRMELAAFKIVQTAGFIESTKKIAYKLHQSYLVNNDHANSLNMYELYIKLRDSTNNQDNRKASLKSQLKYDYEKKAAADSVKLAEEKKVMELQLKHGENQRYFLYGGVSLTLVFGVFMFNRFIVAQKQKNIIVQQKIIVEKQKKIVDQKQKEILDSIHYAKRIQTALLPHEKYIERILNKWHND